MLNAIEHLNHDPGALEEESTPTRQMILQGTMLRDLLLKGFQPSKRGPLVGAEGAFAENQLIQSWARRYQQENPVVMEGDPKLNLNRPQIRAIATMLGERLSLIQGVRLFCFAQILHALLTSMFTYSLLERAKRAQLLRQFVC